MYILNPLEQFEIYYIVGKITNLALFLFINLGLFIYYCKVNYSNSLVLQRSSFINDSILSTIYELVRDQIGKHYYFPFIFTLFIFILGSNFIGLIPYSFTTTSHLVLTIGFSVAILIGITIIGFKKHGTEFFSLFLPAGTPTALIPLLTSIEVISYIARAFSLGIRLFANIVAGHCLLAIISGLSYKLIVSSTFVILKFVPFIIIGVFVGLEFVIAFLQAFVFTTLVASYIKDVY